MASCGRFARSSARPRSRCDRALLGFELERLVVRRDRLIEGARQQVLRRLSAKRIELERTLTGRFRLGLLLLKRLERPLRLLGLPKPHQRRAERVSGLPQTGIERERAFESHSRVGILEQPRLHLTCRGVRFRIARVQPRGREELDERLLVAALQEVNLAQLAMRFAAVGIGLDASRVRGNGAVEVGLIHEQRAERAKELVATDNRSERFAVVIALCRLRQQRLPLVELRELVMDAPRAQSAVERLHQLPLRFGQSAIASKHLGQRDACALITGREPDCGAQMIDALPRLIVDPVRNAEQAIRL